MSRHYFFTDTDLLSEQTSTESYGPLAASGGNDRYRLVSLHQASGTPKAYAICDGQVCIQQDGNSSSLVNLILKPMSQPALDLPAIKYYIYKGIKKSSLISGGSIEQSNANDLTTRLNEINTLQNQSINAATDPAGTVSGLASENVLGIHLNASYTHSDSSQPFQNTDPISNLFQKNDSEYHFPTVKAGWHIGDFDASGFGFMVVVEGLGEDVKLGLAREVESIMEVATLGGSPSELDKYNHYLAKDGVLRFLDPAAFFGAFYSEGIRAKTSGGADEKMTKDEVYDDILRGTHDDSGPTKGNFFNRNFTYLDVRNELNQSLNFCQNYGDNFKIGYGPSPTLSVQNYYTSDWPVFRIPNSSWPSGNTSHFNEMTVQLPEGDNLDPAICIAQGFQKRLGNLVKLKDRKRFSEPSTASGYTGDIELYAPNSSTAATTKAIASIIRLVYGRNRIANDSLDPLTMPNSNYLDGLFPISILKFPFLDPGSYMVFQDQSGRYVDDEQTGLKFLANVGIAQDNANVYFFTSPLYRNRRAGFLTAKKAVIPAEVSEDANFFVSNLVARNKGWNFGYAEVETGGTVLELWDLNSRDVGLFRKVTVPDHREVLMIAFAQATYTAIMAQLGSASFIGPVYLTFKNKARLKDDFDVEYTSYDAYLTGYIDNAGTLELDELDTTYKIYNYDR